MKKSYKKPPRTTLKDKIIAYFKKKKRITISVVSLADMFGEDPRSIYHAIKSLEAAGRIEKKSKVINKVALTNEYIFKF